MREKANYASVDKYKSVPGLISIFMGIGTVIGMVLLLVCSYLEGGQAGIWIGVLGILLIAVALAAVIMAITGLKDPDAMHGRPIAGIIENLIIFVLLILLYLSGL